MSHFSKNTKVFVTDTKAFVEACQELDIRGKVTEKEHQIKMFDGTMHKVALSVNCGKFDIGLEKEEEGRYSIVGDWWGIRQGLPQSFQRMGDEEIQNTILKHTTKNTIKDKYEAEGFDYSVVEDKAGAMQITLTRSDSRY
jgi:hypothetical protein